MERQKLDLDPPLGQEVHDATSAFIRSQADKHYLRRIGQETNLILKFLLIPIREALSRLNAVLTRMLVDQSRKLVLSKHGKIRSVVERLGDCITSERSALQLKQNQAAIGVYAQKIQWSALGWQLTPNEGEIVHQEVGRIDQ